MLNQDHGLDLSPEARQEQNRLALLYIREEIAEVYLQIFLPEWESSKPADWRIERLMNYLIWAITRQMGDEDKGWEETDELKVEFTRLFYYFPEAVKEREAADRKNADETVLPIEQDRGYQNDEEIPF